MRLLHDARLSTPFKAVLLCRTTNTAVLSRVSFEPAQNVSGQKKSTRSQSFLAFRKTPFSVWDKRRSTPTQSAASDSTRFKFDQSPVKFSGSMSPDSFGLDATLKPPLAPSTPMVTTLEWRPGLCAAQSLAQAMRLSCASTTRLCGTCHWRHWCSGPWPVPAPKWTTASGRNRAWASPKTALATSALASAGKVAVGNITIFSVPGQAQPWQWNGYFAITVWPFSRQQGAYWWRPAS